MENDQYPVHEGYAAGGAPHSPSKLQPPNSDTANSTVMNQSFFLEYSDRMDVDTAVRTVDTGVKDLKLFQQDENTPPGTPKRQDSGKRRRLEQPKTPVKKVLDEQSQNVSEVVKVSNLWSGQPGVDAGSLSMKKEAQPDRENMVSPGVGF